MIKKTEKTVDSELIKICNEIKSMRYSEKEWQEIESGDMFQSDHYCGGFETGDNAFWFSYFDNEGHETFFRLDLSEIDEIVQNKKKTILLEEPK